MKTTTLKTGWGAKTWGEQSWGDLNDVTVSVAQEITSIMGISITWSSLGSVAHTRFNFNFEHGQSFTASQGEAFGSAVVVTEGVSASFSIGSLAVESCSSRFICKCNSSAALGAVTVADMVVGITGVSAIYHKGQQKHLMILCQPSGLSITSAQGTAQGISSQEATLTGQSFQCLHLLEQQLQYQTIRHYYQVFQQLLV